MARDLPDDIADLLGPDPTDPFAPLAALPRWVAWRAEDGRKVARSPLQPSRKAESTGSDTWADRRAAEAAAVALGASGRIGLILGPAAPGPCVGGLDLDGCLDPDTGALAPWAAAILDRFASYAEISPSGSGAKLFFLYDPDGLETLREAWQADGGSGEWGRSWAADHHGPELHMGGRWYAVTGLRVASTPAEIRAVTAETLLRLIRETGPAFKAAQAQGGDGTRAGGAGGSGRSEALLAVAARVKAAGGGFEDFLAAAEADPEAWAHVTESAPDRHGRVRRKPKAAQKRALQRAWDRTARAPIDVEEVFEERPADPEGSLPDRVLRVEREGNGAGAPPEWVRNARGAVVWCAANAEAVLGWSPSWDGVLAFNDFTNQLVLTARIPGTRGRFQPREIRDADFAAALVWFNRHGFPDATDGTLRSVIDMVARRNVISPVAHFLEDLRWDGTPRLDFWLTDFCGAEASPYSRAVGRAWLISAVARALRPGCKADHMLILEGPQGLGKSSLIAALCGPDWFSDSLPDMHSKDASIALRGKWILEVGELTALRRSDVETVKAFLSRTEERYRPPYGRAEVVEPRRCVFAGTVNPGGDGYLLDDTGNRRSWPVACAKADVAGIEAARAQLWAEAVAAFKAGEPWHLDRETEALARAEQAERVESDPWAAQVLRHAEALARSVEGVVHRGVAIPAILERMGFFLKDFGKGEAKRVAGVLIRHGWRRDGRFKERGHPHENATRFTREDWPTEPPPDPWADLL